MTQEDKELLLKDLCARLPYGVKALHKEETITIRAYIPDLVIDEVGISHTVEDCKPYLFPLSSMTKKQKEEYEEALVYHDYVPGGWTIAKSFDNEYIIPYWFVDFCNKNHFDYRGLIEKELAIDATGLNIY